MSGKTSDTESGKYISISDVHTVKVSADTNPDDGNSKLIKKINYFKWCLESIYFRLKNYTLIESSDYPQNPNSVFISRAVHSQ